MDDAFLWIDEYSTNVSMNQDYIIRVEAISNDFKIYLNNELIITQTHNAFMSGSIGFRTFQSAAIFKNLRIIFEDNNNWISFDPTPSPTDIPTPAPTNNPTNAPTNIPTQPPTKSPTIAPTNVPTIAPSFSPTIAPSISPS